MVEVQTANMEDRSETRIEPATFADAAWTTRRGSVPATVDTFDPSTVEGLPAPAVRFLTAALPPATPLGSAVELTMSGEIKLIGRWFPFTARQILRAGVGFVWSPVVGGRVLRVVGSDSLGPEGAQIEFRLHGRVPIVRGSGPDIDRSAAGRLAAETVAWLPQALTPQAGATWRGIDDSRATVGLAGPSGIVEVELTVDGDGRLIELCLQRWNSSAKPPNAAPFGGLITDTMTVDGITIAARGIVGWGWKTPDQQDGTFFRYTIESARFITTVPSTTAPGLIDEQP